MSRWTLRNRCRSLNPQLIDGSIYCDTWLDATELPDGMLARDDCDGFQVQFALRDVVESTVELWCDGSGRVDQGKRAMFEAMRAELLQMAEYIDGLQYEDA